MKLSMDNPQNQLRINAYDPGEIKIAGKLYSASLILTPQQILSPWHIDTISALTITDMHIVLTLDLEILLLGTGTRLHFPTPKLAVDLAAQGIGLEVMDTAAACRTFNILAAEDRKVGAALIIET